MSRSSAPGRPGWGRWARIGGPILVVFAAMMAAPPAWAAIAESDLVWIIETETVPEDLYAVGNEIRIEGRVEGDLVAVSGGRLVVDGEVTGSVTALASQVVIGGKVGGSVRALAWEVVVTGEVGGDVLAAAFDLAVDGNVARDVLAAVWSARAGGEVQRDLRGMFRTLNLGGRVGEDVEIRANRLAVFEGMSTGGDLHFQTESLVGQSRLRAGVEGSVVDRKALPPNIRIRGARLMVMVLMASVMVACGLLVVRWRTSRVEAAVARMVKTPWRSLGKGAALVLSPLVSVGLLVLVVLWLPVYIWGPLLVGGSPFLIMAAGLWLLVILIAQIPVAVAVGERVGRLFGRDWDPVGAYLVGAILYLAVLRIPAVGAPLVATVTVAGAGSWLGKATPVPAEPVTPGG